MDCQKMILYGLLLIVGVYVLRDVFNLKFKIPLLEGQDVAPPAPVDVVPADEGVLPPVVSNDSVPANAGGEVVPMPPQGDIQGVVSNLAPGNVPQDQLPGNGVGSENAPIASEPIGNNETFLPVEGIRSAPPFLGGVIFIPLFNLFFFTLRKKVLRGKCVLRIAR